MKAEELRKIANLFENTHMFRKLYFRNKRKQHGLYDGQFPILNYIRKNPDCTQIEIAQALYISPASVAISTKRLQKSGLINKTVDESSLRSNRISLTEKGAEIIGAVFEEATSIDQNMFKGFSDSELETLTEYLERVAYNLAGEEGKNLTPLARTAYLNKINFDEKNEKKGE